MKDANLIILVLLAIIGIPAMLFAFLEKPNQPKETGEILPGKYVVTWYKQAGGFIRSKELTAEQLIQEVHKTFNKAQSRIRFEEFSDGYKFSRTSWRHARNAEGQKFGYITAKRLV
jgi:hypothetical protein